MIVGREQDPEQYAIWMLLSNNPTIADLRGFLDEYEKETQTEREREIADTVINTSLEINDEIRTEIRGGQYDERSVDENAGFR